MIFAVFIACRHSASLWPMPRTEAGITKMAALWERLLEQNGCSALVRAGW